MNPIKSQLSLDAPVAKQLSVDQLHGRSFTTSINEISFLLDSINRQPIEKNPWPKYGYVPDAAFAMAYGSDALFLKYYVTEKYIQAANGATNKPVYQDTCVEFFISFSEGKPYYNIECNCIGTMLVGYGETKGQRKLLSNRLIKEIKFQSVINNISLVNAVHWELTLVVPFSLFSYHDIQSLSGTSCKANFYKCGDHLPAPHFITWSAIVSTEPDFHLPEFFGTLNFI